MQPVTMTPRLLAELQRLFLPHEPPARPQAEDARADTRATVTDDATAAWADGAGRVRVLALALASETGWAPLAALWQGVQAELDLPAPAIAVDGRGALQLWFSEVRHQTAVFGSLGRVSSMKSTTWRWFSELSVVARLAV